MADSNCRPIYCDFLTSDGVKIAGYQAVNFVAQPNHFVSVAGRGFKKIWESGYPANRAIYVEISIYDLTNEVFFDGY